MLNHNCRFSIVNPGNRQEARGAEEMRSPPSDEGMRGRGDEGKNSPLFPRSMAAPLHLFPCSMAAPPLPRSMAAPLKKTL